MSERSPETRSEKFKASFEASRKLRFPDGEEYQSHVGRRESKPAMSANKVRKISQYFNGVDHTYDAYKTKNSLHRDEELSEDQKFDALEARRIIAIHQTFSERPINERRELLTATSEEVLSKVEQKFDWSQPQDQVWAETLINIEEEIQRLEANRTIETPAEAA